MTVITHRLGVTFRRKVFNRILKLVLHTYRFSASNEARKIALWSKGHRTKLIGQSSKVVSSPPEKAKCKISLHASGTSTRTILYSFCLRKVACMKNNKYYTMDRQIQNKIYACLFVCFSNCTSVEYQQTRAKGKN